MGRRECSIPHAHLAWESISRTQKLGILMTLSQIQAANFDFKNVSFSSWRFENKRKRQVGEKGRKYAPTSLLDVV